MPAAKRRRTERTGRTDAEIRAANTRIVLGVLQDCLNVGTRYQSSDRAPLQAPAEILAAFLDDGAVLVVRRGKLPTYCWKLEDLLCLKR